MSNLKILITSGVHGNEQTAVLSVYMLAKKLESFTGDTEFNFIHGVNRTGLTNNCRETEDENTSTNDFNRMFATESAFSVQDRFKEVCDAISDCDIVIDVHNSPACSNCVLISNNKYAKRQHEWFTTNGISSIIRESNTDTIKKYATEHDKLGITVEMGVMSSTVNMKEVIDTQVSFLYRLVTALAKFHNFTEVKSNLLATSEALPSDALWYCLYAHIDGIVEYKCNLGDRVRKGTVVATVHNVDTDETESIKSPIDGELVCLEDLWVNASDVVCYVQ